MFNPSNQQFAIFDCMLDPSGGNVCVDAKAGTGKTTTAVEGVETLAFAGTWSFAPVAVCFHGVRQRHCQHAEGTLSEVLLVSTCHALGLCSGKDAGPFPANPGRDFVDGAKCSKIFWNLLDNDDEDFRNILRLVGLLKSQPFEVEVEEINPDELIEFHGLDFVEPKKSIELARTVLLCSNNNLDTIDFDDMLYLPVIHGVPFQRADWLFIDEAQDLNAIQHVIVERMTDQKSRILALGDPYQAIYGFRGAHVDSMTRLAERFSMSVLPLSVSYRCPQAVVREARKDSSPKHYAIQHNNRKRRCRFAGRLYHGRSHARPVGTPTLWWKRHSWYGPKPYHHEVRTNPGHANALR